ncbi:hypothetical protein F5Y19DRAFT_439796 [Xylariaceae sp. FL1651]|nr:hypothetical protein F5Y19DRAFT_439796 [Xylariaceae sp. FL1651]
MVVGTFHTSIVLAEPGKIHCGTHDPVQGHINIRYAPSPKNVGAELFGPLQVFVILHGRAKTKIWKSNGQSTSIYRGRAKLFSRQVNIYNDSVRATPGETKLYSFSIPFPENDEPVLDQRGHVLDRDDFPNDLRFNISPHQPLPPSFQSSYHGFAHRYESFVEYRVGVEIVTPKLHVDVTKPTEYQEPIVHYERPRVAPSADKSGKTTSRRGYISVRNELLLPESDRPSGFKQKTKALLGAGHFPTYAFDWVCLAPNQIHLGQPVCFEVKIKPRKNECTATLIPEVRLKHFRMKISAHTQVRAKRALFHSPGSEGSYTVWEMMGAIDSHEPFSKANDNTKIVNTDAIGSRGAGSFASSFTTFNISQTYTTKISFAFELAGKVNNIDQEYATIVHPPLEISRHPTLTTAGPSSQSSNLENRASDLPRYEPLSPYEQQSTSAN